MNPIFAAIWGSLFGKDGATGSLDGLLSRFFPSKEKAQEFQNELQKTMLDQQGKIVEAALAAQQAQIDVNKVEAASSSVFVAGWRPAIGWVCGFALAWQFVLQPFATWVLSVVCLYQKLSLPPLPTLDTGPLMTVMLGMLGLTAARTVEAIQGVSRNTLEEKRTP